jgi:hypothetical protein
MKRAIGGPERGHHRLIVEVENDPYPPGEFPEAGLTCKGCGRSWAELQAANFTPPCTKPGESIKIVIEYADDPMIEPFEQAIQNEVEPMEGTPFALSERPEPIVEVPLKPAQDEVLIPSDAELEGMSEAELDHLIEKLRRCQDGKSKQAKTAT